ncbi:hypothetical protein [Streptomyces sp. NPDC004042]|uniref:hypothetical protein n=1 Tax=Streptomyces sp. NPDC004042 TaxID=3154451 RepID=UPI0033A670C6
MVEDIVAWAAGPVLLCYVGHGVLGPGDELYLATRFSRSAQRIARTVSYRTLRDVLGEPAHGCLVLLDCCFAGRVTSPPTGGGKRQPFASALPRGSLLLTEIELVMSLGYSGGSDGQAGLGEAAIYEVAAVLDVP